VLTQHMDESFSEIILQS